MTPDEYRDLQVAAREALCELLRHTEPGTGLYLHTALAQLKQNIEKAESEPPKVPYVEPGVWSREFSLAEREREVLNVLSDQRHSVGELTRFLNERHEEIWVYESKVRYIVTRLYKARELDRSEFRKGKRVCYRYFRRTDLDGPIAELNRAFHDQEMA